MSPVIMKIIIAILSVLLELGAFDNLKADKPYEYTVIFKIDKKKNVSVLGTRLEIAKD